MKNDDPHLHRKMHGNDCRMFPLFHLSTPNCPPGGRRSAFLHFVRHIRRAVWFRVLVLYICQWLDNCNSGWRRQHMLQMPPPHFSWYQWLSSGSRMDTCGFKLYISGFSSKATLSVIFFLFLSSFHIGKLLFHAGIRSGAF